MTEQNEFETSSEPVPGEAWLYVDGKRVARLHDVVIRPTDEPVRHGSRGGNGGGSMGGTNKTEPPDLLLLEAPRMMPRVMPPVTTINPARSGKMAAMMRRLAEVEQGVYIGVDPGRDSSGAIAFHRQFDKLVEAEREGDA